MKNNHLFEQLQELLTEQRNQNSRAIDLASVEEILRIINEEDKKVAYAVETQLPYIAKAVEIIVDSLKSGGRLIYTGAGTSGRLGILDAVECPPTFGTDYGLIQGIIAGGKEAMFRAIEGAEDDVVQAEKDIELLGVSSSDVVCGIAASLRTPYVYSCLRKAKERKAHTLLVTTNPRSKLEQKNFSHIAAIVDVAICPEVGPEVIMGSTRMKSGTAQKMVLNMLTTASMIRLGKVYENMMIDLQLTNQKLQERAKRILMLITNVSYDEATATLIESGNNVKVALVMLKLGVSLEEAKKRIEEANGFVRLVLNNETL